jgi:hypothetical protein
VAAMATVLVVPRVQTLPPWQLRHRQ